MGIFGLNPPESCCNPTSPEQTGDDEAVQGGRDCGRCNCVPNTWKLTLESRYPGGEAVHYLDRVSYRIPGVAPSTSAGKCAWTDTGSTTFDGAVITFEIVYAPIYNIAENDFATDWYLLDWGGSVPSSLIPDRSMRLINTSFDSDTLFVVGSISPVFFNCMGLNSFELVNDPASDPPVVNTIEVWRG